VNRKEKRPLLKTNFFLQHFWAHLKTRASKTLQHGHLARIEADMGGGASRRPRAGSPCYVNPAASP
jgi:hypothetical protein